MADRVKIYEEKKKTLPIWMWLLPLLILLALLAYFLTRPHTQPSATTHSAPATVSALPDLGSVHFDTDKATLTAEGQATLQRAAAVMKSNPSIHLRLEGFTDSTGSAGHNGSLSDRRAQTVADYLKAQGIPNERLTGTGLGAAKPVDNNDTSKGKADNRRVELFTQQ